MTTTPATTGHRPDAPPLDRAAGFTLQALQGARVAQSLAIGGDPSDMASIRQFAQQSGDSATAALAILQGAGARLLAMPPAKEIPLHLLASPANCELLAGLEALLPLAERVDAERGFALPAEAVAPGECRGVDLAELVAQILARVRGEVLGPVGRDA